MGRCTLCSYSGFATLLKDRGLRPHNSNAPLRWRESSRFQVTKLHALFARFMIVLSLAFMAAPLAGCSENKLPQISMPTGSGTAATGQYNITNALERNWYAAGNRGGFLLCWLVILAVPWGIFFGVSGWMFGKREKPFEIIGLLIGAALMYNWATAHDLEPWLLLTWVVPCAIYLFLKGEDGKFKVFGGFAVAFLMWSLWMAGKAIVSGFTYHPVIMLIGTVLILVVVASALNSPDEPAAAHAKADDHGGGHH